MGNMFEDLRDAFKGCFDDGNFYFSTDNENYIWAAPTGLTPDNVIHYELLQRGTQCFIELHIESNVYRNLVDQLHQKMSSSENQRFYTFFTYYSSKYWQTRTPVFTKEDVEADVKELRAATEGLIRKANSQNTNNVSPAQPNRLNSSKKSILKGGYATLSPQQVAKYLKEEKLIIPDVQRGKVWNVARIGTLWDSLLRGFPIGSFSAQENAATQLELLDGQQRSYAISLGYGQFPPEPKDPILWIELAPEEGRGNRGDKDFLFYVTTCSQPWGYRLVEDEMRNTTLSAAEKRQAVKDVAWHNTDEKPYPYELCPYLSKMPVPVPLLTEWFSDDQNTERPWGDFANWCCNKKQGSQWYWLKKINTQVPNADYWKEIGSAFTNLEKFEILFSSAAEVSPENIALYFTRIGRGGVIPSDEELAYSVLKSKIGGNFRKQIENIAENGMASSARIAHLAIRCFTSKENEFYCGSALEQVNRIKENSKNGSPSFCEKAGIAGTPALSSQNPA